MAEINITTDNFESEVMNSDKTVLIDFWATWCGPCKMIAPAIESIAEKYEDKVKVCKINVDEEPELANAFEVASIPMIVIMKDGKIVNTSIGYKPMEQIEALLQ